jgi:hypothetical protein
MSIVDMPRPDTPVPMLPTVNNEQLQFVSLDFKPYKICNDWRKLLMQRSDFVAAKTVILRTIR